MSKESDLVRQLSKRFEPKTPISEGMFLPNHSGIKAHPEFQDALGTLVTGVSSVSNSDSTLTISPTTGNVVASLNLGHSNTWTANQTFGTSGTGATVTFNSDLSGVNLIWDHDATAGNPLLQQTIENARTSYWDISGTDTSPATMSTGIFSIRPTFTTGTTGRTANLLYFALTDSRSISATTQQSRIFRGEVSRSGTKTTTAADDMFAISLTLSDTSTYNAAGGTSNKNFLDISSGPIMTISNSTAETINFRGINYSGTHFFINTAGTNPINIYGFDFMPTYSESISAGAITATVYGLYYHPTMSSAVDVEYALRADRAGILLASDGTSATQSTGRLVLGAGSDFEIFYNGTDAILDPTIVTGGSDVLLPRDNLALALGAGAGGDCRLYYDGTDMIADPDVVGTGDFKIAGNENIVGEAKGQRMTLVCSLNGSIIAGSYLSVGSVAMSSTMGFRMPRAGSIVGVGFQANVNGFVSSGNTTCQVRVNGSNVFSTTVAVSANGDTGSSSTQNRNTDTFAANDLIQAFVNIDSGNYAISGPIAVIEIQMDT